MKRLKEIYLKKIINKKEYIVLFAVALLIMIPYMGSNYIAGDDTDFHMSNIYAILQNILGGSIGLDKILPIIGNDFGYATGIFYPRLAHIFSAYMSLIFMGNITLALKIVHFLVYLFSAIMMYRLVNRVFKNKFVAMIAGIFYITFPYSISEVFSRDALAESFVYLFTPMVLLGLYELFNGNKKAFYLWFVIGYIGLINSHLVLSVYFTAFVLIYLAFNIKKVFTKENFMALLLASVIILLITSPFTVPLLEHKAQGIYHVFESDSMSNRNTIAYSAMGITDYLKQESSEKFSGVHYYLNLLALGMSIVAIVMYKKLKFKKEDKTFYKFLIVLAIATLIIMSQLIPWGILPQLMIMIQFTWRLEAILIIALSILAALALSILKSKKSKVIWFIIILIFNAFTVYNSYNFDKIKVHNIEDIDISYWGMGYEKEYLPEVTIQNIDYYNNRGNDIKISEESTANIEIINDNTPELKAIITNNQGDTVIELPRIYYLGYTATIEDEDGNISELDLYMNGNGFIETVINTNGTLTLTYEGTTANKIANIICVTTILVIIVICVNLKARIKRG